MHLRMYLFQQSRIITGLAMPVATAAIAVLMLRRDAATPEGYFRVMVGGGLAGMWGAVLGTALFTVRREREWYGTLPLLVGAPAPLDAVFGGYVVAEACAGFAGIAASLGTGVLILGAPVGLESPSTLVVSLPLAALAMAAIALPVMALALPVPVLMRWVNGIDYPIWILAGFLFPVALLPAWTGPLSYALPAYWATEAMRQAAVPHDAWARAAPMWLATFGLCICYAVAALGILRLVIRRAQRTGALVAE